MTVIFITGGARSGKSACAEARTLAFPGRPLYIATAEAFDAEMAARIDAHRARRDARWETITAPRDLVAALLATDPAGGPRLVDCLTLWLSNVMLADGDWQREGRALAEALRRQKSPVVLVSNEVGLGIVPDNALARAYRDAAGTLNQWIAAAADEAHLVVAGLPLRLK